MKDDFLTIYLKGVEDGKDKKKQEIDMLERKLYDIQQENKQLKEKIKYVDEFCDRYMGVKLELFDMYELLNKIREILGDKENE